MREARQLFVFFNMLMHCAYRAVGYMIIDLLHTSENYDIILNHYGSWDCACPKCHARQTLHRHGKYERNLTLLTGGKELSEIRMEILRLQCSSCKSTHAILTVDMIPFFIYALPTVLQLISLCRKSENSVPKIEKQTGVSYQLLYYYLRLLSNYQQQIQEIIKHSNCSFEEDESEEAFASLILRLSEMRPSWLLETYFRTYHIPIFMTRKSTVLYPLMIEVVRIESIW